MRPPPRWLGAGALAAVVLGGALFMRRPARGVSCGTDVVVEMELESVTEGGAPASTDAYLDYEVSIYGEGGTIELVAHRRRPPTSQYEEFYRAAPGIGRR